jgi:hypothetical protein
MGLVLEHVQPNDWNALNRTIDLLAGLVLDTGGQSLGIRVGQSTVTFTASALSATTVVSHGLGRTPVAVFYGNVDANMDNLATTVVGATTFTVQGRYSSAVTGTASLYWMVVG